MPQLDLFTWFNQVCVLFFVFFIFYYLISFCYLNITMVLFKARAKLLIIHKLVNRVFILTVQSLTTLFVTYFLNLLTHNVYLVILFNQFASINQIKTWIFYSTSIAKEMECFYFIQEQVSVSNNLNIQ